MEAIEQVIHYIENELPPPEIEWGRREFDQRIYERWAAENILGELLNHSNKEPEDIVYRYLLSLISVTASCVDNKKLIFSSAIHTAEAILNIISKESPS